MFLIQLTIKSKHQRCYFLSHSQLKEANVSNVTHTSITLLIGFFFIVAEIKEMTKELLQKLDKSKY